MTLKPLHKTTVMPISKRRRNLSDARRRNRRTTIVCRFFHDHVEFSKKRFSCGAISLQFDRDRVILTSGGRQFAFRADADTAPLFARTRIIFALLHFWREGDSAMFEKTMKSEIYSYLINLSVGIPGLLEIVVLSFMGAALEKGGIGSFWINCAAIALTYFLFHGVKVALISWARTRIEQVLLSTPARIPLDA